MIFINNKYLDYLIEHGVFDDTENVYERQATLFDIIKIVACAINGGDIPDKYDPPEHYIYDYEQDVGVLFVKHHLIDVVEIPPLLLKAKAVRCNLNDVSEHNFINTGYFLTQKEEGAFPLSMLAYDGKWCQYDENTPANKVPHGKPAGCLIIYKDGSVEIKAVDNIPDDQLSKIHVAIGGLSICPSVQLEAEGFTASSSEDGKDYTDVARETRRVIIGYNPSINKIVIAGYEKMSAVRGRDLLKALGCDGGITCDAGGSATMKVDGEWILKSDGRQQFGILYW